MTKTKQEPSKLDFISDEYEMPKGLLRYQVNGHGMTISQAVSDWVTYLNNGVGYYCYNILKGFINQSTTKLQEEINELCI